MFFNYHTKIKINILKQIKKKPPLAIARGGSDFPPSMSNTKGYQ